MRPDNTTFKSLLASLAMAVITITAAPALEATETTEVCAGCHGPKGHSAVPDNPILAAQHAAYLATALQEYINGARDNAIMKTMAQRLSASDIEEIAAYYAAQPPHQSPAPATGDAIRGEAKTAACVACHGTQGHSVNPMFPNLAGQHAAYLSNALRAYRSGSRTANPMLTLIAETLSDQDIEDIAAFYAAQPALAPQQ